MFDVKGRRAIITGGAQGFGKEFGLRLVAAGCRVCLADLDEAKGQETKAEIQRQFNLKDDSVCFVRCNVAVTEDWPHLWDEAEKSLGGSIDILVNNAGINPRFGWEMNMDVMLVGAMRGLFLAVEKMKTSTGGNGGRIINTASMAGLSVAALGPLSASGYTVSKHGMVSMTRCFRSAMYRNEGIKCYTLAPWFADTNLVRSSLEAAKQDDSTGYRGNRITNLDELSKATRTRVLTVEEVGHAFMTSLERDKNGAVYAIMPDSPLIEFPDYESPFAYLVILMAKHIGGTFGITHFSQVHFCLILTLIMFLLYLTISTLICSVIC